MEQHYTLIDQGIGLTDVVQCCSNQASRLQAQNYRNWGPILKAKLGRYQPLVFCVRGLIAYFHYLCFAKEINVKPQLDLRDAREHR